MTGGDRGSPLWLSAALVLSGIFMAALVWGAYSLISWLVNG